MVRVAGSTKSIQPHTSKNTIKCKGFGIRMRQFQPCGETDHLAA
jgi:hypothetical protein